MRWGGEGEYEGDSDRQICVSTRVKCRHMVCTEKRNSRISLQDFFRFIGCAALFLVRGLLNSTFQRRAAQGSLNACQCSTAFRERTCKRGLRSGIQVADFGYACCVLIGMGMHGLASVEGCRHASLRKPKLEPHMAVF